jgi:hypothetical protein
MGGYFSSMKVDNAAASVTDATKNTEHDDVLVLSENNETPLEINKNENNIVVLEQKENEQNAQEKEEFVSRTTANDVVYTKKNKKKNKKNKKK